MAAFKEEIIPLTYLLTPNIPEAQTLTGIRIEDEDGMKKAAQALQRMGATHVLVKGGHLQGAPLDILCYGNQSLRFETQRIDTRNTHGTGCTIAAALAALLALGFPLPAAAQAAKDFIHTAITSAPDLGHGHGPVNHYIAAETLKRSLQLQNERNK